jgi:hypothetical protein
LLNKVKQGMKLQTTVVEKVEMEQVNMSLPVSPRAFVEKIRLSVKCGQGHSWGVTLLPNLSLPVGWDRCAACSENENKYGHNLNKGGDDEQAAYR